VGGGRLPTAGQRPGEGTSIGTITTTTGETFEWPRYAGAGTPKPDFDGDIDYAPLWAGTSVSVVNNILPAGEIVRRLARDAEAALAELDRPA
jgi:NAD(P)H-dependent flavin oxidoreductase YrpB (nitropropane dioxygenase family)